MPERSQSAPKDSELLTELRALGDLFRSQGDLKRAEQHYRLALALYESSFPESHVEATTCLFGLIQVLERLGKSDEAAKFKEMIPRLNARRRTNEYAIS